MSPPTKRQRSGSNVSESTLDATPQRSEKFWFDDGDIVLQTGSTLFRVHRFMLARHSKVFEDMLCIGQRQDPECPIIENCPLVVLSDTPVDLEQILAIFYDNVKALDKQDISTAMAVAMLRLGRKYQIDYLFNDAWHAFRADYPTRINGWDPTFGKIRSDLGYYPLLITCALELSLETVLPPLYLDVIGHSSLDYILDGMPCSEHPGLHLDFKTVKTILLGRDRYLLHLKDEKAVGLERIFTDPSQAFGNCKTPDRCKPKRTEMFLSFNIWELQEDNMPNPLYPPCPPESSACSSCRKQIEKIYHQVRNDTWNKLPSFFGLGASWKDLKDDVPPEDVA